MKTRISLLFIIMCLNSFGQLVYIDKKEITPSGITEFGGVTVYNGELYLMLSAKVRYDGKIVEASEAKSISQKYRVWNIFRYNPATGEMGTVGQNWSTTNASPNGFCIVDDSTIVYTNAKSQLVTNNSRLNLLIAKVNNEKYHFTDPCWDQSRKRLYFAADYPGGRGGMDIWYIETEGPLAGAIVNAGEINSSQNELSPTWSTDSMLVFVSNSKKQQYDIYMYNSEEGKFITPESTPATSEFFTASDRKGKLYFVAMGGGKQELMEGKVSIRYIQNVKIITPVVVEEIPSAPELKPEPEMVKPSEVPVDDPDFRLDNFFGTAKYTLTPLMQDSLNKIAEMLKGDPSLSIVICGHSSPDGSDDRNMLLSSYRANEAYKWLQGKGVADARIFRVYGGEYLYENMMYSRMFSVFPVTDTDLPQQMAVVPDRVLGNSTEVYSEFGVDPDDAEYWRFVLKDQLPVGDKGFLLLPVKEVHYVAAGETLYSLSKQYGMTVEKMMKVNGLKDSTVPKGKILYIPAN